MGEADICARPTAYKYRYNLADLLRTMRSLPSFNHLRGQYCEAIAIACNSYEVKIPEWARLNLRAGCYDYFPDSFDRLIPDDGERHPRVFSKHYDLQTLYAVAELYGLQCRICGDVDVPLSVWGGLENRAVLRPVYLCAQCFGRFRTFADRKGLPWDDDGTQTLWFAGLLRRRPNWFVNSLEKGA